MRRLHLEKGNVRMFDSSVFNIDSTNLSTRISQAAHYLEEYEKEVARAQGAADQIFRSKDDALGRIKLLVEFAPDDERVKELFARAKACVKGGAGKLVTVDEEFLRYLANEDNLKKHFAEASEKAWNEFLSANSENRLEKNFPVPDFKKHTIDDMKDKIVVLDNIRYPDNQFDGTDAEYIWSGTRSDGMYFLKIDGREWLGPYEAVKRYRRQVDTDLSEVREWSVIGKISGITCDIPDANESKVSGPVMAWVVDPIALYVPGHIMAVYDEAGEHTGRFIDEDKLSKLKEDFYTVKAVPDDVTPERLVEIFMTAIKEKNFNLYLDCISPQRKTNPVQQSLLNYHWDLHQERFHGEYVHANINPEKTVTRVVRGYDDKGIDSFFLDEEEQEKIKQAYGEKEEEAIVQTSAFDKNGKQIGSPTSHILRRIGNGRWYIDTYETRF